MTRVTFISSAGAQAAALSLTQGQSVMEAAVQAGLPGIDAECGGSLVCATCHVYLLQAEGQAPPEPAADELEMLDFVAAQRRPESRLSCQLRGTHGLQHLTLQLPDCQVA